MKILILQGNPDPAGGHFGHALAAAYAEEAKAAGHDVKTVEVAKLEYPPLRTGKQWQNESPPAAIAEAQQDLQWADHYLIVFPLWLGDMPAVLKAFLEQALRPGFALGKAQAGRLPKKLLKGRSARILVTMGMPAFFYRIFYRAHSLKNLKRNILEFCGIDPVRTTMIGMVEGKPQARAAWLAGMAKLARADQIRR